MKVTLKDIAERANVSISTVSRVLNNQPISVEEKKISEIKQIAKSLGYRKMRHVQKTRTVNSNLKFGCVLYNMKRKYNDPYFSEIIYGIERELLNHGHFLTFTYDTNELIESNYNLLERENSGIITVGSMDEHIIFKLSEFGPVIAAGGLPSTAYDCITTDFAQAAFDAVNTLIKKGHKKIGFIGSRIADSSISLEKEGRFLGYKKALTDANLPIRKDWIEDGKFDISEGHRAMERIIKLEDRPTAMFIASDRMAYGAYHAVQEVGLLIPDDIAIISFDDLEMSAFLTPSLSTVHVHKEEIGRVAVRRLLQKIEYEETIPIKTFIPTELKLRDSSG